MIEYLILKKFEEIDFLIFQLKHFTDCVTVSETDGVTAGTPLPVKFLLHSYLTCHYDTKPRTKTFSN